MQSSTQIGEYQPYSILDATIDRFNALHSRVFGDPPVPTLLHVTHAKAGSSWINNVLLQLFRSRCAPRGKTVAAETDGDLSRHVFESGKVYRAMFMSRPEVLAHPELQNAKRFIVIRDMRDTLISLYFSLRVSHPLSEPTVGPLRSTLENLSKEEGLLHLIDTQMDRVASLQESWVGHNEILIRYEDVLANPFTILKEALIARLGLPVSESQLGRAIRRTHFQNIYKRKLGEENIKSHGRKGVPGDWKCHFSPQVCQTFALKFGKVLIHTGYETDDQWANA